MPLFQLSTNALTRSLRFSFSPGMCREGFGMLSGGSEVSFLLRAVSQAVPQTPGVWQPHQFLRPCTQTGTWDAPALQLHTRTINRHTSRHFIWSLVIEFGCVSIVCVDGKLLCISMSIFPLDTVPQQVTVGVWQPHHLTRTHTVWNTLTRGRYTHKQYSIYTHIKHLLYRFWS